MRPARAVATTAVATALAGLAAPAAMASVDPQWVHPGRSVWVSDDKRCGTGRGATAFSAAFGTVRLRPGAHRMLGSAKIPWHSRGTYKVTVRCADGKTFFDWLHVGPTKGSHTGEGGGIGGMDNAELAGGAALVALAAGSGAVVLRRRTKGRS
jgi:hypothetical protein